MIEKMRMESVDLTSQNMEKIAENAKIQRPSVCNAIECIVVNSKIAAEFLPRLEKIFAGRGKCPHH